MVGSSRHSPWPYFFVTKLRNTKVKSKICWIGVHKLLGETWSIWATQRYSSEPSNQQTNVASKTFSLTGKKCFSSIATVVYNTAVCYIYREGFQPHLGCHHSSKTFCNGKAFTPNGKHFAMENWTKSGRLLRLVLFGSVWFLVKTPLKLLLCYVKRCHCRAAY